jgi:hypothetical protein
MVAFAAADFQVLPEANFFGESLPTFSLIRSSFLFIILRCKCRYNPGPYFNNSGFIPTKFARKASIHDVRNAAITLSPFALFTQILHSGRGIAFRGDLLYQLPGSHR